MGRKGYILVAFLLLLVFFSAFQPREVTPYNHYYRWYTEEIALPIDQALKDSNDTSTIKQYHQTRKAFFQAYEIASDYPLPDKNLDKTHQHLISYLEWRIKYVEGFIQYLQTKSRDTKALVNNYNDEGNIHYSLFISNFDEYAKNHNQTFLTPNVLY
ncbi:hypothetical protein [Neobacillus sp. SuZ13]|uniref:hypothetical protein n=1 Tax=Neobacillus sp. SuZ13 TaxID=3047875 RepID=UPI0024C0D6AF|nr:hypothetical protein [Neobacillus sp. SuZ13]WHY67938.1 hypothetical protein QNH17_04605 [Neobacillus sp. SuZ13]